MASGILERAEPRAVHGHGRMVDVVGVPVEVLIRVDGVWQSLDLCDVFEGMVIHSGRSSSATPVCEPVSLSLEVIDDDGGISRTAVLRRPIAVMVSQSAVAYWGANEAQCLFLGLITEVAIRSDPVLGSVVNIMASSKMADLGRTYVGDTPWSQESALVRAHRVMGMTGYETSVFSGPYDPEVLPRDVDRQPALDLVAALATDGLFAVTDDFGNTLSWDQFGVTLWQEVPLEVTWENASNTYVPPGVDVGPGMPPEVPHALLVSQSWREQYALRRFVGPLGEGTALDITACELFENWSASYSLAGMVNRIAIRYGPTPEGSEQAETIYTDQRSIDKYGLLSESRSTALVSKVEADEMARFLFVSWSTPRPVLPTLLFDLWRTAYKSTGTAFFTAGNRPLVAWWRVPDFPPVLPVNRFGYLWLEGIQHTITASGWEIEASVSDPWSYGNAWQWGQVPPEVRWVDLDPLMTWETFHLFVPPTEGTP